MCQHGQSFQHSSRFHSSHSSFSGTRQWLHMSIYADRFTVLESVLSMAALINHIRSFRIRSFSELMWLAKRLISGKKYLNWIGLPVYVSLSQSLCLPLSLIQPAKQGYNRPQNNPPRNKKNNPTVGWVNILIIILYNRLYMFTGYK